MIDDLEQPAFTSGLIAVADRFQQQFPERPILEGQLAQHVEDLAAEGLSLLVELFEQPVVDFAFASILGDKIPQVADFGLTDAVDAAESLFQAVGIPGQVVVHHQVGTLQVDAFAGGVSGDEDFDFLVVLERFLGLAPFLAAHAAVNDDDGLRSPDQRPNLLGEIIQRVAMLGEDDELAAMARRRRTSRCCSARSRESSSHLRSVPDWRTRSAVRSKSCQLSDLGPQFGDGPGGGCLIDDPLLGLLNLRIRGVVEVFDVVGRE